MLEDGREGGVQTNSTSKIRKQTKEGKGELLYNKREGENFYNDVDDRRIRSFGVLDRDKGDWVVGTAL